MLTTNSNVSVTFSCIQAQHIDFQWLIIIHLAAAFFRVLSYYNTMIQAPPRLSLMRTMAGSFFLEIKKRDDGVKKAHIHSGANWTHGKARSNHPWSFHSSWGSSKPELLSNFRVSTRFQKARSRWILRRFNMGALTGIIWLWQAFYQHTHVCAWVYWGNPQGSFSIFGNREFSGWSSDLSEHGYL